MSASRQPRLALAVRALISLVLVIVVLGGGVAAFSALLKLKKAPEKSAQVVPRTVVRVQPARRQTYQEWITAYGRARALRSTMVAAELGARVTGVSAKLEAGVAVTPDDVLVTLDDRDLIQQRRLANAALSRARIVAQRLKVQQRAAEDQLAVANRELASAREELKRTEDLVARKVLSQAELDRRRQQTGVLERLVIGQSSAVELMAPDLEQAASGVTSAEATLAQAELALERTRIRAPYAGTIVRRDVQLGARVGPGSPLFTIVDTHAVEIPLAVPASHHGRIRIGARVRLQVVGDGERAGNGDAHGATGTVARRSPTIDAGDRSFTVYVLVRGPDGRPSPLPPGAYVTARIEGRLFGDVVVVPRTVFVDDRLFVVRTPEAGGESVVHPLSPPIHCQLPGVVLLREGLPEGARIVVTNLEQIDAGTIVRVAGEAPR